jgi:hypothetical protein
VEVGLEAIDVCVDLPAARGDRHREPLVAILDEIGVIDLDQGDRQVDDGGVGRTLPDCPPELDGARPEATIEIVDPTDRADDVGDRHLAATDRQAGFQPQTAVDLVEREQVRADAAAEG